jgi:hypothetical protein
MDEIFKLLTKHNMLQHVIDVFTRHPHHFLCQPNKLNNIVIKFTQVQVGKIPTVTSYCFWFGAALERILWIHPYPCVGTNNGFIIASRN